MMQNKLLNVACIDIQNTPTKVFTIGGDISSNPKEVILVIPGNNSKLFVILLSYIRALLLPNSERMDNKNNLPLILFHISGNPGLGGFYVDFMQTLYNNLEIKVPIWCVSHAGHYDIPGVQPLTGNVNGCCAL